MRRPLTWLGRGSKMGMVKARVCVPSWCIRLVSVHSSEW